MHFHFYPQGISGRTTVRGAQDVGRSNKPYSGRYHSLGSRAEVRSKLWSLLLLPSKAHGFEDGKPLSCSGIRGPCGLAARPVVRSATLRQGRGSRELPELVLYLPLASVK